MSMCGTRRREPLLSWPRLGYSRLLPFLKAVCQSRKSWQARHTGIKIVQQIAILVGCAVLPHLRQMVEIIEHGLVDDQQKVRTIRPLAWPHWPKRPTLRH